MLCTCFTCRCGMPGEVRHLIDPISSGLCHISLAREETLHIVVSPEKTCSHLRCFQWREWICPTTVFYKCKESRFWMHIKWLKTTESLKMFILFCWNNSMYVLLFKSAFLSCSHLLKVFQTACWLVAVKIKYKLSVGYINNVSQTVMPALQLSLGILLWYVLVVVVKPHVKCMCNSVVQCGFYAGLRGSCQSGKFGCKYT